MTSRCINLDFEESLLIFLGHPINQGVLKFQTVTKSPYGNKGGVQAPTKIHMTSPASQRSISDNQITTTIRNKNIQTPVCYVQTKLDHSEIKVIGITNIIIRHATKQFFIFLKNQTILNFRNTSLVV